MHNAWEYTGGHSHISADGCLAQVADLLEGTKFYGLSAPIRLVEETPAKGQEVCQGPAP